MNRREKEEYLREYAILKAQGKPFFPYAVAKDSLMACVVMACIITMSLVLGAELGSKANPTTTTYVPRPEWYFFFLFEVLRVVKPPSLVPLATIGVPTLGMILLFLLPFYDRGPERRPERRPIATAPTRARRRRSKRRRRPPSCRQVGRRWPNTKGASSPWRNRVASRATRSGTTATMGRDPT
jgi:hypothetical protein